MSGSVREARFLTTELINMLLQFKFDVIYLEWYLVAKLEP